MMDNKFPFFDKLPCGVCDFSSIGENLINCRAKGRIPQNAKSVIVYLFPYYLGKDFYENSNISKYAVPEDYHIIAGDYLKKATEELREKYLENKFEYFCDNSPIPEVSAAVGAGLGVKGKNGLLINEKYGSFCFIGEIVTDKEFDFSLSYQKNCLNCGMCVRACPGGAISDGKVDRIKCFSDITQRKNSLPEDLREYIEKSGCVWGCDICQDVCPMNKNLPLTPIEEFRKNAKSAYAFGDSLENRAFAWRGKEVIDRNLKIMCCKDCENEL